MKTICTRCGREFEAETEHMAIAPVRHCAACRGQVSKQSGCTGISVRDAAPVRCANCLKPLLQNDFRQAVALEGTQLGVVHPDCLEAFKYRLLSGNYVRPRAEVRP